MKFFNRRTEAADPSTAVAAGHEKKHNRNSIMSRRDRKYKGGKSRAVHGDGQLNRKPKFGQWLKATWPDILTMVVMGMLGLGVSLNAHTVVHGYEMLTLCFSDLRSRSSTFKILPSLLPIWRYRLP